MPGKTFPYIGVKDCAVAANINSHEETTSPRGGFFVRFLDEKFFLAL
mgnify:CR=1 FL=1|tara:strand:+ start:22 stop:162 length:141 start_codon:yes stop_codon:yes gene_type:complete